MDALNLASGDSTSLSPRHVHEEVEKLEDMGLMPESIDKKSSDQNEIIPDMMDKNELKLKERIKQCREIIESLKLELKEEKAKLGNSKNYQNSPVLEFTHFHPTACRDVPLADIYTEDFLSPTNVYENCVDNKLKCDENLMEYEKQLQKYQNTLNLAQLEKKNIIRKQMLAKAYRLKILEIENQCNIELLRVKQILQCLEPLQMIANKWKCNTDYSSHDINNFELIPRYSELSAVSASDISSFKDDSNNIKVTPRKHVHDDPTSSHC
ncbi:uncharacterized protein LOC113515604 [Galleria mellonella]|uniref:Uncharacterized protein LOC113515604 n=1 Tax=Galleria mellonella TaxID=7137 RepID=A0A6J1WTQ7_GALME|nr:uncharacterized protein LOC113515604 [Galleria mellonella]